MVFYIEIQSANKTGKWRIADNDKEEALNKLIAQLDKDGECRSFKENRIKLKESARNLRT